MPLDLDRIVSLVATEFGGERTGSEFNPLVAAFKDGPPTFALGVDVREVVNFVAREVLLQQINDEMKAICASRRLATTNED